MKEGGEISLDAILVAYLDGELEPEAHEKLERLLKSDPSVRERLAMLSRGARPFKRTFDAVLDLAPRERLQAQLTASVNEVYSPKLVCALSQMGNGNCRRTALGNWSRYSWLYSRPILARPVRYRK